MHLKNNPAYNVLGVPLEIKADDITEEGKFKGWGSTFGGTPDSYGDVVVKGAFKETIMSGGRNGNGIAMLYQHMPSEPIGVWTKLEEKDQGLYVEGELIMDVQRAKETHSLMSRGAIKGLSIGYDIARLDDGMRDPEAYEYVEKEGRRVRFLKKLDLWEISPVTFPANIRATVTSVKDIGECITIRDCEDALIESGFSKNAAQLMIKRIKQSLRESGATKNKRQSQGELETILETLRQRNLSATDF